MQFLLNFGKLDDQTVGLELISDLLKILEAIQSSQSDEERAELESKLLEEVKNEIKKMFEKYPKRRRTFGALRQGLGIFDPPERQEELKKILFDMGARPTTGDGDEKYWHLPKSLDLETGTNGKRSLWPFVYTILLLVFLIASGYTLFADNIFPFVMNQTLDECLKQKNLSMMEISNCFRE